MKRLIVIPILLLIMLSAQAQTPAASGSDSAFMKLPLKQKLAGKTWSYVGMEKFHHKDKADSTQKNDVLVLNDDMTFTQLEDGKNYKGTWSVNETAKILTLTDAASRTTRSLKVANIIKDQMALRYQDEKLVTYYKFYYTKDSK